MIDQLLQTEEVKLNNFNIDKHALAESLLAWEKLPWLGDEKILKLVFLANYYGNNDLKAYHFLQAACDLRRILFIRNSKCYAQYINIYKAKDEYLTWIEALHYRYNKNYDRAANLFHSLINSKDGAYVNRASIILNLCRPHLSEPPQTLMPKA